MDASRCANCDAVFDSTAAWRPLEAKPLPPPPSRAYRMLHGALKMVMAATGLAFLGLGALVAAGENKEHWAVACAVVAAAVIGIAFTARTRWSVLMMLVAVAFGFVSCTANFKWHGG